MIKYLDGEGRKTTVEATMNHINVYLNGRQSIGEGLDGDRLLRYYEEFVSYTERMKEEFDLTEIQPAVEGRGLKGLVKKVIAKCVGWYSKDIDKRQTDFNLHLLCAVNSEKMILEQLIRQTMDSQKKECQDDKYQKG